MLFSIAIPIVIEAIVMVIISNGMLNKPRLPSINKDAIILGTAATKLNNHDLNKNNKAT